MARGTTTTASTTAGDESSSTLSEPKTSKRRCVPSACVPCRKRKSKCDGGTPKCATCTAVYKTDCHYDESSEARRGKSTAVKRDLSTTSNDNEQHAEFLIRALRTLPEADVGELVNMLRRDPNLDVPALADTWRRTGALPFSPSTEQASLEGDLSLLMGKPAVTQTGESRHFGHTSSLGLVPEDENYTRHNFQPRVPPPGQEYKNGTWTTLTQDIAFVERLLDLYFQWSHPFYVIFSRECFYRDFQSGRPKYCSPLLVNAILSYACHFSDEPQGRTDPNDPRTAGDHFFAEARRLLYEDESPSLTTTQALCVMAMREPSAGRDSSGFMYIGRCMRMAIELGLHLDTANSKELQLTPSEIEVRKVTFWGCFIVDTVWTICIGRIAQLPRSAITVEKPKIEESTYPTTGPHQFAPHVSSRIFLEEFAKLSELINDNNFMFFAPKERFTSRRLLAMYEKYQNWYRNLPAPLHLPSNPNDAPLPHFLVLHMLYYTVILHLFRPMLKVDLIGSDVRPRDICIHSANKVSELLRVYRMHYDMRACQLVFTHILLSSSIVHLVYSQKPACSANLVEGLQALEALSVCHHFGARSFKIVHNLAKTWNLPWPEALKLSKLVPKEDATVGGPPVETLFYTRPAPPPEEVAANEYSNPAPSSLPGRRESLSMFSPTHQHSTNMAMRSPPMDASPNTLLHQNQNQNHQSMTQAVDPYLYSHAPHTAPAEAVSMAGNGDGLFWSPFPNVGVPILTRDYNLGPMDLNTMLETTNQWDRYGRDGFKMSEAWPTHDPTIQFVSGGGGAHTHMNPHGGEVTGPEDPGSFSNNNTASTTNTPSYPNLGGMAGEFAPSGPCFEPTQWWSGDSKNQNQPRNDGD